MSDFNKELREVLVGFRVSKSEKKKLDRYAKKHKTTVSKVMHKCIFDVIQ